MTSGQPATARARHQRTRTGAGWLAAATTTLFLLAAAAAVVSWDAQYVMVARARDLPVIAALEAGIPDAGAAVFAALGITLALHGRPALRPRVLNPACVGLSVTMNALAAGHGWRDLAIWVMPAAVYALASDTLIGVVRAWAIARSRQNGQALADDDLTPLAAAGTCALWLLRLLLAPVSTLAAFRRWVITACPPPVQSAVLSQAMPGQIPAGTPPARTSVPSPDTATAHQFVPLRRGAKGKPCKQDLLIALASQRNDLRTIPLTAVAAIATQISTEIDLHPGTARRILRAYVQTLQDQH
jgi:hypothetical protein